MRNVTSEISNPFGMRPPCDHPCTEQHVRTAVFGYGDANADFHVIGDHPGIHGGTTTGIPFTGSKNGKKLINVLTAVGLIETEDTESLSPENCFLSYLHCCCVPEGSTPSASEYEQLERFFDAELRAISADVLIPVGRTATMHVLKEYTNQYQRISHDMTELHANELRGRGFLVVPLIDPSLWTDTASHSAKIALTTVLSRDYKQMVDLGRFLPGGDPYFVR